MRKAIGFMLAVLLVLSAGLVGCQKTQVVDQPVTEAPAAVLAEAQKDAVQEYSFSSGSEVTTFDPHKSGATPAWAAQAPIYENLVRYTVAEDGTAQIEPGVAKEWAVSDDGLTWTFKLREDAKWADGSPLNANDFVYSWHRIYDPATASDYEWMVDTMIKGGGDFAAGKGPKEAIGVKAIDDYTLEFQLNMKVSYFLQIVSFPTYKPVNKAFIEKYGEEYGSAMEKVMGNGPFIISSWNQQEVVYVPNPNYWDKENVFLTKINRKIVKEENPRAQALIAGEIDTAGIAEAEWRTMLDSDGRFEYQNEAGANVEFYMYQLNNKFLANKKIRQALSMAHDRDRFVAEVGKDFGFGAFSIVPTVIHSGERLYTDIVKGENEFLKTMIANNPDPKELLLDGLEELGMARDPKLVDLTIQTRGTGEYSKESAEWLKQMYAEKLGIDLKIEMTEWNVMWDNVNAGNYDIAVAGWTADLDDPSNLIDIFHTDPKVGYYHGEKTGWKGPEADKFNALVKEAQLETDPVKKAEIYVSAERILLEEAVISPAYFGEISSYRANCVKGLYSNSFTYLDYKGVFISGRK